MNRLRIVSAARKRKLRKRGARVWWEPWLVVWVWDITAPRRNVKRGAS